MRLLPIRADHAGHRIAGEESEADREQIVAHMDGNICRCGTYSEIIAAIQSVA
jgi:aerobic-type carbon monoxide dehydrogenase small subunit (CoxS/CutS family)